VWFGALLAIAGLPFMPSLSRVGLGGEAVRSTILLSSIWAVIIVSLWAAIAFVASVRIVAGLWKLHQLRNASAVLTPANCPKAVHDLVAQLKSGRPVVICQSSAVRVPTVIGFFRPAILLPDWTLQELSAEELKVVLLHEIAHLERGDDWTNLTQKLVRTVFFFHPAVWWIERHLNVEREMACDDEVLAHTDNPQAYAECLVALAEKSFARRGLSLAQAVVGHARDTALRLARILDGDRTHAATGFKPTLGIAAVLVAGSMIALPHAPKMVAFQSTTTAGIVTSATTTVLHFTQARVVPASLPTEAVARKTAVKKHAAPAQQIYRAATIDRTEESMQNENNPRVELVRASVPREDRAPQWLFVLQTTQFDEDGSAIVQLSVWRVTIDPGQQSAIQPAFLVRKL
jgi:beta-lactamase regulating signal transducer with metallopeptidase domain